jgi:predicted transcriptional regulator
MELMGIATIREVAVHTPSSLWKVTREICGVSHEEYVTYFSGAKQAVGLFIDRPTLLKAPVSLSELRTEWGDFRPPQEFRYLSEDQQRFVLNHLPAGKRALTAA